MSGLICFSEVKRLVIVLFVLVSTITLGQQGFEMQPEPIKVKDSTPVFNHQLSAGIGLHSSFSKDRYEPPSVYYLQHIDYTEPHGGYYFINKTRPIVEISHTLISKWGISFKTEVSYFNYAFVQQSNIDSINKYIPDSINTFLYYRYTSNDIELRTSLGFCKKRFRGFVGLKIAFLGYSHSYKEDKYGVISKMEPARILKRTYIYPTARVYYILNYSGKFQFPLFIGVDMYRKSNYDFMLGIEITFLNK